MKKIILIGTADTARDAYCFINDYKLFEVIGFAVDERYRTCNEFCGLPVYDTAKLTEKIDKNKVGLFAPIMWNHLNRQRRDVYERLSSEGFQFVNLISPTAVIHSGTVIGNNCWISDGVIIGSNARIGNNVFIMAKGWVAHYSIIENHCFLAGASMIAGKTIVGEQSFIGINAMIFDGVTIGRKCLVGACCHVKRSLPDYSLVKTSSDSMQTVQYDADSIEEKLVAAKNIR